MESIGKTLIIVGILIMLAGLFFLVGGKIPYLGKMPGDISVEKENFRFYFPLTTSIMLSIILSFLFWLFSRFK